MNDFKDFGIVPESKAFEGDKIKIDRILNKEIVVYGFKIGKSKFEKGNGDLLTLQIHVDNSKRILFTGSSSLMEMVKKVPEGKFPFNTTIIKENERFIFT
jgi:hypothetical protein